MAKYTVFVTNRPLTKEAVQKAKLDVKKGLRLLTLSLAETTASFRRMTKVFLEIEGHFDAGEGSSK